MEETDFIEIGTKEFSFTVLNINPQRDLLALTMNINGLSFGTLESPTYIPSFIGNLRELLQDPFYKNYNLTSDNFAENLCINNELIKHYNLTLEETFDDFSKRGVRNQESIFFLFKLHENPFFTYPISGPARKSCLPSSIGAKVAICMGFRRYKSCMQR